MKKLKLDLDQIAVDSFDAAGMKGRAGTVRAESYTYQSGDQCHTGLQDSCYSCPAPPYCVPEPISNYC
ncbi:MAG TPA: hypothetical protein VFJ16_30575 [Longimicrobium sp.]|nr:hypothetical protein [Longimicrobium sp.]